MLDADLKTQLAEYLTRLVTPVQITACVDDSTGSRDMIALLADIVSLTPMISVKSPLMSPTMAQQSSARTRFTPSGSPAWSNW